MLFAPGGCELEFQDARRPVLGDFTGDAERAFRSGHVFAGKLLYLAEQRHDALAIGHRCSSRCLARTVNFGH
jgi:hypothetical protein